MPPMGDSGITSAEVEGFTVTTNSGESSEEITESLKDKKSKEEKPDLSAAASKLGKKGVEAKKAKSERDSVKIETQEDGKPEKSEEEQEDSEDEKADADEKAEDEKKPKRDRSARGRVLEATRKEAEAKRERDAAIARAADLERRLEALERGPGQSAPREAQKAPQNGSERLQASESEPQEEDFDTYRDFVRAMARWEIRQEMSEVEKQREMQAQAEAGDRALMQHIDTFRTKVADSVDDFSDEVLMLKTEFQLSEGEAPSASNWIANELVFSPESAPTLMRYFSEHPSELQRLAALPTPRAVSREMAKLETRLDVANTGKPDSRTEVEVSRAHPPVTPVAGASGIGETDPAVREGESFDSWNRRTHSRKVSR